MNDKVLDRPPFVEMSPEQQQRYFAEWGFVLLPGIVTPEHIERIIAEEEGENRYDWIERWPGPAQEEMITQPRLLAAIRRSYGEDIRFFKSVYAEWREINEETRERGRQILHRDYDPGAPGHGDFRNSCAAWVNVGHYLIDLDIDEGPLWVVPGSHRLPWVDARGNFEHHADDARMVLCKAGDAVMFHNRTMHAGGVMQSGRPRPSVFLSYRAGWAAPMGEVPEWPTEVVARASAELRPLIEGLNDGVRVDPYGVIAGGI